MKTLEIGDRCCFAAKTRRGVATSLSIVSLARLTQKPKSSQKVSFATDTNVLSAR